MLPLDNSQLSMEELWDKMTYVFGERQLDDLPDIVCKMEMLADQANAVAIYRDGLDWVATIIPVPESTDVKVAHSFTTAIRRLFYSKGK